MGNCAIKPKVLSENGAPAPEELEDSLLLEDQKIDATKSLSNLFLQDKVEKKTKEDGKITPEKSPVNKDLKTALAEAKFPVKETKTSAKDEKTPANEVKSTAKDEKYPANEVKSPTKDEKSPATETDLPADDKKVVVVEDVTDEAEEKPEEVKREAA